MHTEYVVRLVYYSILQSVYYRFLQDSVSFHAAVPTLSTTSEYVGLREGEKLKLLCNPSDPLVQVDWFFDPPGYGPTPLNTSGFVLSPPNLNHR